MKVKEVMTQPVRSISVDGTIREAAKMMRDENVGYLLVCEYNTAIGAVTDRDLVTRGLARDLSPGAKVFHCMTDEVVSCYYDTSIEGAAIKMSIRQVRRLVVKDEEGSIIGVVSLGDIAEKVENKNIIRNVLKDVHNHAAA